MNIKKTIFLLILVIPVWIYLNFPSSIDCPVQSENEIVFLLIGDTAQYKNDNSTNNENVLNLSNKGCTYLEDRVYSQLGKRITQDTKYKKALFIDERVDGFDLNKKEFIHKYNEKLVKKLNELKGKQYFPNFILFYDHENNEVKKEAYIESFTNLLKKFEKNRLFIPLYLGPILQCSKNQQTIFQAQVWLQENSQNVLVGADINKSRLKMRCSYDNVSLNTYAKSWFEILDLN